MIHENIKLIEVDRDRYYETGDERPEKLNHITHHISLEYPEEPALEA
jgi:hypothetical protein